MPPRALKSTVTDSATGDSAATKALRALGRLAVNNGAWHRYSPE